MQAALCFVEGEPMTKLVVVVVVAVAVVVVVLVLVLGLGGGGNSAQNVAVPATSLAGPRKPLNPRRKTPLERSRNVHFHDVRILFLALYIRLFLVNVRSRFFAIDFWQCHQQRLKMFEENCRSHCCYRVVEWS